MQRQTIILGTALLALLVLAMFMRSCRYEIVSAEKMGVWRYDRITGESVLCLRTQDEAGRIVARCP